jgi:hypothetical protein
MIKERFLNFVICYLLSVIFLVACQTVQKAPEVSPLESGIMPLDKGASAYVLVDVEHARPILEGISYIPMTDKNMKQMLDRTKSAAVAVFLPSSQETRRFQLVSRGNYPVSGANMAFGTNKDWKKQRSAPSNPAYWHSEKAQMSVAVSATRAYVLAAMTKTPHDPMPSPEGIKIPDGFAEFGHDAALACWLSDPGPVLNKKLREMGVPLEIPAEQLFVNMFPADDQKYEANVKIIVPGATQARAVVTFLALARVFMPQAASPGAAGPDEGSAQSAAAILSYMLFTNPPVQDGSSLLIKMPPLGVNEIALLFSMFSL